MNKHGVFMYGQIFEVYFNGNHIASTSTHSMACEIFNERSFYDNHPHEAVNT